MCVGTHTRSSPQGAGQLSWMPKTRWGRGRARPPQQAGLIPGAGGCAAVTRCGRSRGPLGTACLPFQESRPHREAPSSSRPPPPPRTEQRPAALQLGGGEGGGTTLSPGARGGAASEPGGGPGAKPPCCPGQGRGREQSPVHARTLPPLGRLTSRDQETGPGAAGGPRGTEAPGCFLRLSLDSVNLWTRSLSAPRVTS